MKSIGLDLGTKTLGIAISDKTGLIASSYKTIFFNEGEYDELLNPIKDIIEKEEVENVVLGLPKNMNKHLVQEQSKH